MTLLTRFSPFQELSSLQDRMNTVFRDFNRGQDELFTSGSFVPAVDVYEDEHNITLKLEVPGIQQKDVDVRLENNTLTVKGERRLEKEEKEENFHRIERRYGSFTRSFALPNTVNPESVTAEYVDGILKIKLEKRAEAKPRQIKVNVGTGKPVEGASQPKQVEGKPQAA